MIYLIFFNARTRLSPYSPRPCCSANLTPLLPCVPAPLLLPHTSQVSDEKKKVSSTGGMENSVRTVSAPPLPDQRRLQQRRHQGRPSPRRPPHHPPGDLLALIALLSSSLFTPCPLATAASAVRLASSDPLKAWAHGAQSKLLAHRAAAVVPERMARMETAVSPALRVEVSLQLAGVCVRAGISLKAALPSTA